MQSAGGPPPPDELEVDELDEELVLEALDALDALDALEVLDEELLDAPLVDVDELLDELVFPLEPLELVLPLLVEPLLVLPLLVEPLGPLPVRPPEPVCRPLPLDPPPAPPEPPWPPPLLEFAQATTRGTKRTRENVLMLCMG